MYYGVQLFGCSGEFRRNPEAFFDKMRELGLLQIEPCVMFDDPVEFKKNAPDGQKRLADDLWKPEEIGPFKKRLESKGLSLSSVHIFASSLPAALPGMVQAARENRIAAYVVNTPLWALREPDRFAGEMTEAAKILAETGTGLWLHNCGDDFVHKIDWEGEEIPVYLYILKKCGNVYAQVDTGWVIVGGIDPAAFIKSNLRLVKGVHFKDMAEDFAEKSGPGIFEVLGRGCVDVQGVLDVIPADMPVVIDQDLSAGDFIADLEESAKLLYSFNREKIKCVIFDVDGTLLDSMPMWHSLAEDYAVLKGIALPEDAGARLNTMSLSQCAAFYGRCGVKGTEEEIFEEIVALAAQRYRESIAEKPGARDFIAELKENGIHVALATASHVGSMLPALERAGIMPYVDMALACEDIGKSKEHPDIFIKCAEAFGASPRQCVVVEDSLYSARTAKNAGFRLIGIDDPCHSGSDRDALRRISDRYIADFRDIAGELGAALENL